jgi:hypothetical protein
MSRLKTIKTVASTLTIALAVGFIMQYDESGQSSTRAETGISSSSAPRTLMMATTAQGEAVFGVPNVVTSPLGHAVNMQRVVAVDVVYTELDVPELGTILATPIPGCETALTAKRQAAAIVELNVSAPCFESAEFTVHHEEMVFSAMTDRDGNAVVMVPALVTDAAIEVAFSNVVQASVEVFVPELRRYDRAVLQWQSADNMRLHALEGGAQIGDPGHVWSASIHTAEDTREGLHGFVVYVGAADADIPHQAEVYTFPAGQMNRDGGVDLQVGVGVTEANCAREVDATTIQTNAGGRLVTADIVAQMPSCDAIGDVVLLSDKFTDLQLASR